MLHMMMWYHTAYMLLLQLFANFHYLPNKILKICIFWIYKLLYDLLTFWPLGNPWMWIMIMLHMMVWYHTAYMFPLQLLQIFTVYSVKWKKNIAFFKFISCCMTFWPLGNSCMWIMTMLHMMVWYHTAYMFLLQLFTTLYNRLIKMVEKCIFELISCWMTSWPFDLWETHECE